MKLIKSTLIILLLLFPSYLRAAVYYVDATRGNDSNTGTSPDHAWQTISKVNAETFYPGDSILFKKGEMWREKLSTRSSGSSSNPITYGTYGTGNAPIINGAELLTNWTEYSENIYRAEFTPNDTGDPIRVWRNSSELKEKGKKDSGSGIDIMYIATFCNT